MGQFNTVSIQQNKVLGSLIGLGTSQTGSLSQINIIKHAFCLMELALNTVIERLATPITFTPSLHCWAYHVRILAMVACRFHNQAILGINFFSNPRTLRPLQNCEGYPVMVKLPGQYQFFSMPTTQIPGVSSPIGIYHPVLEVMAIACNRPKVGRSMAPHLQMT